MRASCSMSALEFDVRLIHPCDSLFDCVCILFRERTEKIAQIALLVLIRRNTESGAQGFQSGLVQALALSFRLGSQGLVELLGDLADGVLHACILIIGC